MNRIRTEPRRGSKNLEAWCVLLATAFLGLKLASYLQKESVSEPVAPPRAGKQLESLARLN